MAQQYLINKSNELNNTNAKIMDDIQKLSAFPLDPDKLAKVSQNVDGYGTSLYYSNSALSVLNSNSNLFTASQISTFSSSLSNAINNLSQLQSCSAKSYNGILCRTESTSGDGSSSSSGTASGSTSSGGSASSSTSTSSSGSSVAQAPAPPPRQQNSYFNPDNLSALQAGLLTFTGGNREFFQGYSSFNNIYGGMPIIEGLAESEMINEKTLITQLNTFNEKYARYLKCNDKWNNSDCAASEICIDSLNPNKNINVINCTPLRDIVDTASNINRSVANLKNATTNMGTGRINQGDYNIPAGSALTPEEYEMNYNLILDNHTKISKLRNELDNKIQMLYNPEKSINADYKKSFDATIYSGILISALATSILFYTFNQL
jgi:hypothetical protein